ncbi:231_t:CDS:2 [Acaulospora morrowiae]|uniref:231_t:CDS:1 n=1 Tax=Acaulospora morrowiae TaxID=94023 RepID=A0A9N9FJP9_9GLOM|nr:231_t:CDS:2 [Acaulospora morrowiae]
MSKHDYDDYEEKENEFEVIVDKISPYKDTNINPHNGKSISKLVYSPNMKYVATISDNDNSIVVWKINDEHSELEPVCTRFLGSYIKNQWTLSGVLDYKYVLLQKSRGKAYDFEIIDIQTGSEQILKAQSLTGAVDGASFLENGDVVMVKGEPSYRAYIFSKPDFNSGHQWRHKGSIEINKYHKYVISRKGKLLILLDVPSVIMQWDLETLKFEAQYLEEET